jgi:P27 family predicted phage terminase small subunit
MRGRKPAPTALKLLAGAQPCRINRAEPALPAGRPDPPAHLDEAARGKWDEMVATAERMGTLTQAEGEALAIYCQAYSRMRKAEKALLEHGLVVDCANGGLKSNPALRVIESCEAVMLRIIAEFGLTPSSRSKVAARDEAPVDALGEFLSKRAKS